MLLGKQAAKATKQMHQTTILFFFLRCFAAVSQFGYTLHQLSGVYPRGFGVLGFWGFGVGMSIETLFDM